MTNNEENLLRKKKNVVFTGGKFSYKIFSPAPGVIQTNPVIIPWMAPITDGFLNNNTSQDVHTNRLVAAQM